MQIIVKTTVSAPINKVWNYYTTPEHIVQWNAASDDWHTTRASVDLRAGGEFSSRMEAKDGSMGFDFAGVYEKVIEPTLIEYSFGERKALVQFIDTGSGIEVSVSFDPENTYPIEQQQQGWQSILDNFKRYTEAN